MALSLFVRWPAVPIGDATDALARSFDRQLGDLAGTTITSILIAVDHDDPNAIDVGPLMDRLAPRLHLPATCEITADLPAQGLDRVALDRLAAAGVNRLSLKGGTLDAAATEVLARASGRFPRVAFDLAFGRPGQTMAAWRAELTAAVAAGAGHVSLEEAPLTPVDAGADFYLAALDHLDRLGLPAYEIAHCARTGEHSHQIVAIACGGAYLGIGPGAVSRLHHGNDWHRRWQIEPDTGWHAAIANGHTGIAAEQRVPRDDQLFELVDGGLRLRAGLGRDWFQDRFGRPLDHALPADRIEGLARDGLLATDRRGIRLTERGWPLCDAIVERLLR